MTLSLAEEMVNLSPDMDRKKLQAEVQWAGSFPCT